MLDRLVSSHPKILACLAGASVSRIFHIIDTRAKFFEVFDTSMKKRLADRLLYIVCSQNWEAMGPHYWIKQCIELLFSTSTAGKHFR
jgi:hypothetical protein